MLANKIQQMHFEKPQLHHDQRQFISGMQNALFNIERSISFYLSH